MALDQRVPATTCSGPHPSGCGLVFASKNACFRCGLQKPEGAGSQYGERQQGGYGGGGGYNNDRGGGGGYNNDRGGGGGGGYNNDEYRSSGRAAQVRPVACHSPRLRVQFNSRDKGVDAVNDVASSFCEATALLVGSGRQPAPAPQ